MNSLPDSLIAGAPIVILVFACVGAVWSVLKKRKYLIGFACLFLGAGIYYWGLYVGKWEGIAISLFGGGGVVFLGLIILLLTYIYSKLMAAS